ncbi:hypothetical protein EDD99_0033 [Streptomyces sp. 846.5]|nr:hypothetical protein [Streptomyces sp. 846.5]TDU01670.1 hypothetical protein EDD99_0033 [Streptomyces sp. 846.5]
MTEHEAEQLPTTEPEGRAEVATPEMPRAEMVPVPVATSRFRDVASDLQCAAQAVRYVEVVGVQADIATTLQLAVVVTGSTPAQALTAAAAFARESPMAEYELAEAVEAAFREHPDAEIYLSFPGLGVPFRGAGGVQVDHAHVRVRLRLHAPAAVRRLRGYRGGGGDAGAVLGQQAPEREHVAAGEVPQCVLDDLPGRPLPHRGRRLLDGVVAQGGVHPVDLVRGRSVTRPPRRRIQLPGC